MSMSIDHARILARWRNEDERRRQRIAVARANRAYRRTVR